MARERKNNKSLRLSKPLVFLEGSCERIYLNSLVRSRVIKNWEAGSPLAATLIEKRISSIRDALKNQAIDVIVWIVDGKDQHIKDSKVFLAFYREWEIKHEKTWRKLFILKNSPSLELWWLLHYCDCYEYLSNAQALERNQIFRRHFPDYEKNESYISSLIVRLEACKQQRTNACRRAELLEEQDHDNQAQIYRIFEEKLLGININTQV